MSNVINFPTIKKVNLDPDIVLDNLDGVFTGFIIAGYDKNGEEFFSTTYADVRDALLLLERCKLALLSHID